MARRRSITMTGPTQDDDLPDRSAQLASGELGGDDGGSFRMPTAEEITQLQHDAIAGNAESAREVFQPASPRSFAPAAPMAQPPAAPEMTSMLAMLPQGVEASGAGAGVAPMQQAAPQSMSMQGMPPATASGGPARQKISSPVNLISGGDRAGGLVGRGAGLTGGGIGMPGGPSGGPKATEQMLALLEELGLA